jgi:hypothetical protein
MRTWLLTRLALGFLAAVVLAIVVVTVLRFDKSSTKEYRRFISPDGNFAIVVFRKSQLIDPMPGGSGDASGTVCLVDAHNGTLLEQKKVEMVQTIDRVTWSSTNVDIRLFADWKLR